MPQISDPQPTQERLECHTAMFEVTWPEKSTAVVAVNGELDAANGAQFVEFALRKSEDTDRLVIDLSGLTFFATAGFTALHNLNVQCVGGEIRWALVPSAAVIRLLRICDPDSALPICSDVDDALTTVHNEPPRLLQLVPEPS
ncbi:MAG TPA: STAS domain-containing protein [Mycobacterium sp.]